MIKLGLTCISELLKEVDKKNNSFRVMTRKRFNDLTQSNNKEFAIQQLSERIIHNVKLTKKIINHCIDNNINLEKVVYIGNDINDKEVMGVVGKTYCPSDAHESIKLISDHILITKGGDGVVRELLDLITKNQGV